MNRSVRIPLRGAGRGCKVERFDHFGLYVFRTESLYLAVRGGGIGQDGFGGHAHVDALSFELVIHGEDWALDPGTFLYTADPLERDRYRSAGAHNGVLEDDPRGILDVGLFRLADVVTVHIEHVDDRHLAGVVKAADLRLRRELHISDDELLVVDGGGSSEPFLAETPEQLDAVLNQRIPFCPAYGLRLRPSAAASWRTDLRVFRNTTS